MSANGAAGSRGQEGSCRRERTFKKEGTADMKRMKKGYRGAAAVLLAGVIAVWCGGVTAAESTGSARTITLGADRSLSADSQSPTFWEFPQLQAGETRTGGRLTLRNSGEETETIALRRVELPYDDPAALAYLDALYLTVQSGDTVVYSGTYAHCMDEEGGLQLAAFDLAAGGSETYTISMSCDFGYTGSAALTAPLNWRFGTSASSGGQVRLPGVLAVLCVSGGVLVICAVLALVAGRRRRSPRQRESGDG